MGFIQNESKPAPLHSLLPLKIMPFTTSGLMAPELAASCSFSGLQKLNFPSPQSEEKDT